MKKLLIVTAVILAGITSSQATEDFVVRVKKTSDGFLALRKAPTPQSEIIAKLPAGTVLEADTASCETREDLSICDDHIPRRWVHVTHVPGHADLKAGRDDLRGWVWSSYTKYFECKTATLQEAQRYCDEDN
jgi:hypothetical protein